MYLLYGRYSEYWDTRDPKHSNTNLYLSPYYVPEERKVVQKAVLMKVLFEMEHATQRRTKLKVI